MLYLINGEYYMYRNREYIKVDVELKNNGLNIKPDRDDVIEDNGNVKAKSITVDSLIKEMKKEKSGLSNNTETRSKYDR